MKELQNRNQKKLDTVRQAQEKKDRLIEEVRQQIGYSVSIKDPRFVEMLEQKEKEVKKSEKEAKKKIRTEKAMKSLSKQAADIESSAATEVKWRNVNQKFLYFRVSQ